MKLKNEQGKDITITDTITLPNGGIIYIDANAYYALDGRANSYDWRTKEWTSSIQFKSNNTDASAAYENTEREY